MIFIHNSGGRTVVTGVMLSMAVEKQIRRKKSHKSVQGYSLRRRVTGPLLAGG